MPRLSSDCVESGKTRESFPISALHRQYLSSGLPSSV